MLSIFRTHHYHARIYLSAFHICENGEVRGSEVARDGSERRTGVAVLTQLPGARCYSFTLFALSWRSMSIRHLAYAYTHWSLMTLTTMFTINELVAAVDVNSVIHSTCQQQI